MGIDTAKATLKRIPRFTTYVETEVDISSDALHHAGWHYQDECKNGVQYEGGLPLLADRDVRALGAAIASLHRQAHPSGPLSVRLCREEPCRSLTLDQLGQVDDDR